MWQTDTKNKLKKKHFTPAPSDTHSSRKGVTMLLVLILLSILISIGAGIFSLVFNELIFAADMEDSFLALYAADEGAERIFRLDLSQTPLGTNYTETNRPVSSGACYDATLTKGGGTASLNVVGRYKCASSSQVSKRAFAATYTSLSTIAYWKFDETSGITATDSSGSNNGTASIASWAGGKINNAHSFNGTNIVSVPDSASLRMGDANHDFSVGFWMYLRTGFTGAWRNITHKGNIDGERTPAMWMWPTSNQIHFRISTTGLGNDGGDSVGTVPLNTWTYVTYIKNGNQLQLYLNGALDNAVTLAGTSISNTGPLTIGKDPWYPGVDANIDDYKVYDRALSSGEIQTEYLAYAPVGFWKFNEGSGATASDSSGTNNNGTLTGGPLWTGGHTGNALNFNGANYVDVPENDNLDPSSITIMAWVKIPSSPTNFGNIVSKGGNPGYRFRINNDRTVGWFDQGCANCVASTGVIPLDTWTHIAVTGNSARIRIFINGNLDGTNAIPYSAPNTADSLKIGGEPLYNEYFNGLIDDVRIYNKTLSQAQIRFIKDAP